MTEEKKGLVSGVTNQGSGPWSGSWERPLKVDPNSLDPLTLARMTDHNVRGMEESSGNSENPRSQQKEKTEKEP